MKNNLKLLSLCSDLLEYILDNIIYRNADDLGNDYMNDFDLGNNTYIKREDLESIESIIDTIKDIKDYNK